LLHFGNWLRKTYSGDWRKVLVPDLTAYAEYAMSNQRCGLSGDPIEPLSARSMSAHLSTIRGQYNAIRRDRELLFDLEWLADDHPDYVTHRQKVEEILGRMIAALDTKSVKLTIPKKQDEKHVRLTQKQAEELIAAPFTRKQSKLKQLRDSALFALMLATGVREDEAVNLRVSDLRVVKEDELSLEVRKGKRAKQRLIPYGDNSAVLRLVDRWLEESGIMERSDDPYVFPAFKSVKSSADEIDPRQHMTTRSLQRTLKLYPVTINGVKTEIAPHDLRRTYARREHDAGTPLKAIQENMGHEDAKTTLGYIGQLDYKQRRSRAKYQWDELIPAA
jgi:site-specific recombinase XerD